MLDLLLLSLLTSSFAFLFFFFFSLTGHLPDFILVRKVFGKAFRIIRLDGRKWGWVVEQDFHRNFPVNFTCLFAFFLTHSAMV